MTSCEAGSVGIDIEHKHAAMKFCKTYREYMQRHQDRLPGVTYVEFKKFKKVLKHCTARYHKRKGKICGLEKGNDSDGCDIGRACHSICPKCDQAFFPSLLDEMAAVVCCFNARAKRLLDLHLATGFRKYLIWMTSKLSANHMIQEGKNLMSYASINAIAIRKILKKYDKVHCSKQGREFRMRAQAMHMEILQSPLLNELIAFHINLMDSGNNCAFISDLYADCSLTFEDEKPYLSCTLLDSVRLDVDLTCSICLETVFDPISLKCGHMFCYSCACSAASVTVVDGLKKADHNSKCPLCRQARVYEDAVHLVELSILLSKSCKDYWEQRLQRERVQRLQQAKEHWESQCRAFMGFGT